MERIGRSTAYAWIITILGPMNAELLKAALAVETMGVRELCTATENDLLRNLPGIGYRKARKLAAIAYQYDPECRLVRSFFGIEEGNDGK